MEISFDTRELRSLCEQEKIALDTLGIQVTKRLQNRLADLDASKSIFETMFGVPVQIANEIGYEFDLSEGIFLGITANHVKNPRRQDGNIDWANVYRVKVNYISGKNYE